MGHVVLIVVASVVLIASLYQGRTRRPRWPYITAVAMCFVIVGQVLSMID